MKDEEKLFSVTAKDCRWDYYSGTGKGGQNRNRKMKCARCFHDPSGAVGKSEEENSLEQNKKKAFVRMAKSKKFQDWVRLEGMKKLGVFSSIEHKVNEGLIKDTIVESKQDGKWIKDNSLQITAIDVKLMEG